MEDQPAKIACDDATRIVIQQAESGELFARIERQWPQGFGQWVEFAQCSGADGQFLIYPKNAL